MIILLSSLQVMGFLLIKFCVKTAYQWITVTQPFFATNPFSSFIVSAPGMGVSLKSRTPIMINKDKRKKRASGMRLPAEKNARKNTALSPERVTGLSPEEIQQMFHELQNHQIELELQNEELKRTQWELEASRDRYFNFYDLSPLGYFTVDEQGVILESNLMAATLLRKPKESVISQPLTRFIFPEDQDIYYLHRKRLVKAGESQTCELRRVHSHLVA